MTFSTHDGAGIKSPWYTPAAQCHASWRRAIVLKELSAGTVSLLCVASAVLFSTQVALLPLLQSQLCISRALYCCYPTQPCVYDIEVGQGVAQKKKKINHFCLLLYLCPSKQSHVNLSGKWKQPGQFWAMWCFFIKADTREKNKLVFLYLISIYL